MKTGANRHELFWTFVIYDHPRDFPDHYVVRPFILDEPQLVGCLCATLDEARDTVPAYADFRSPPHPDDDPKIVETWI